MHIPVSFEGMLKAADMANGEWWMAGKLRGLGEAAEVGDPDALYALGMLYKAGGEGYPKKPHAVETLLKEVAQHGHVLAKRKLASMYYSGDGVENSTYIRGSFPDVY